jgi:hypothetical protein
MMRIMVSSRFFSSYFYDFDVDCAIDALKFDKIVWSACDSNALVVVASMNTDMRI